MRSSSPLSYQRRCDDININYNNYHNNQLIRQRSGRGRRRGRRRSCFLMLRAKNDDNNDITNNNNDSNNYNGMTEMQREKLVRQKLKTLVIKKPSNNSIDDNTSSNDIVQSNLSERLDDDNGNTNNESNQVSSLSSSSSSSALLLPYTSQVESTLSNPLVELSFAFMCLILTACDAIETININSYYVNNYEINTSIILLLEDIENLIILCFSIQYIARWYVEQLRVKYIITPLAIVSTVKKFVSYLLINPLMIA